MMRSRSVTALAAALLLAACGQAGQGAEEQGALGAISVSQVAQLLSPEAKAAAESYERDVRAGIAAYKAQFGTLPTSFADIPSAAALRGTAVDVIADGLGEQVPFASRETLEKAAGAFVSAAEQRIFDQVKAQDAQQQ